MSELEQAVRAALTLANTQTDTVRMGEYGFSLAIEPGNFLSISPEEVFEGLLPADLINDTVQIRAQLITGESAHALVPEHSATIYCELPVGPIDSRDGTLLACVLNEFNADGVVAGSLFSDTSDNSVYYRQHLDLSPIVGHDALVSAISGLLSRTRSELTYAVQGMVIFKRKVGEARDKHRHNASSKVVELFPRKG